MARVEAQLFIKVMGQGYYGYQLLSSLLLKLKLNFACINYTFHYSDRQLELSNLTDENEPLEHGAGKV
jgi:hypothetical protein